MALEEQLERYVAFWNTADFTGIEAVLTEDFQLLENPRFEPRTGTAQFQEIVRAYHAAYPDCHPTVDEVVYGRDAVAGIWTITGTNSGAGTHPPTRRRIEVQGLAILHFENDRIRDEWIAGNDYRVVQPAGLPHGAGRRGGVVACRDMVEQ